MDEQRRHQIEHRWQEIYRKIAEAERTGESPLTGVDAAFYCGQLLEELDELEFELGLAYFEERGPVRRTQRREQQYALLYRSGEQRTPQRPLLPLNHCR